MSQKIIYGADLFAGAGGESTGFIQACQELGVKLELVAVNHWEVAIGTHEANYPNVRHMQADVEAVNPLDAVPGGHLHLLTASPECIWWSNAAGGRPMKEQQRTQPWSILRWLEMLTVDAFIIENVPELRGWGPLNERGRPIKEKKGTIYRAYLRALRAHGYTVEERILNAADYGAPTSRRRLFIIGIKGTRRPSWPSPTHSRYGSATLAGQHLQKWVGACKIIDWSIPSKSAFNRKKPLSQKTWMRILEGLKRFGGAELKPFIIKMEHQGGVQDVDDPLPTITTAKGGAFGLAQPEAFTVVMENVNREGPKTRSVGDPLWTVTTKGSIALAEASVIVPNFGERKGQPPRAHSVDKPLPTVTSHGAGNLVKAMILPVEGYYSREGQNKARSIDDPLGTITQRGGGNLVEASFLTEYYGNGGAESVEDPLHTVTTKDRFGLCQSSIIQFNGTKEFQLKNSAKSINDPLPTIATQTHFGLVQPEINGQRLEIKFRMLNKWELALAMGFPAGYKFVGNQTEVVKQIGNAVAVPVSKALCLSLLKKALEAHA